MVLTDKQIRDLCNSSKLISPFVEEDLQSESYDLSIGKEISTFKNDVRYIDLANQDEIDKSYVTTILPDSGYELLPKEYIMVELKETITLPNNLTAHIRPRTKFTRVGLLVSDQHCNSTYSGVLRLGLFNATNSVIKIQPGLKIAQIVFEELKEIPTEDKLYMNKKNASYQNETEFIGGKFTDEVKQYVNEAVDILLGKRE